MHGHTILGNNVPEVSYLDHRKVLAITKRTAELCGTQSILHSAGFEWVTATRCVIKARAVKGVIVCLHSWSEEERESIASEVSTNHPEVTIIVRCPGCTGCDEASCTPGALGDTQRFTNLIASKS